MAGAAAAALPPSPTFPGARSLVWIAAHPDDDVLVAPLLGRACRLEELHCTLLVLTRGEAGHCVLPNGCGDLGARRTEEMRRAARYFGAAVELWDLEDGGGPTRWETASGGRPELLARLRSAIDEIDPDVVLTFDPRHGSTCHGDHRAVGELVSEALDGSAAEPAYFLLETVLVRADGLPRAFRSAGPATAGIVGIDAAAALPGAPSTLWQYLLDDLEIHRTQFDQATKRSVRRFRPSSRVVYLAPARAAFDAEIASPCE